MTTKMENDALGTIESENQENAAENNVNLHTVRKKGEDLSSGMELLELDFLLAVVENTDSSDNNDIGMRKLTFYELLRRDDQNHIDSSALAVYSINQSNFYPKDIQCEAMKELTKRTNQHS